MPREKLELIDVSRSVAIGISIVDVIRGADYQTRSLLLASRPVSRSGSHWHWVGRRSSRRLPGTARVAPDRKHWFEPPAAWRTGSAILMRSAWPASPPAQPSS